MIDFIDDLLDLLLRDSAPIGLYSLISRERLPLSSYPVSSYDYPTKTVLNSFKGFSDEPIVTSYH